MKLSNLTPEARAKAAGLAIVALIALGVAGTELLSSAFAPAQPELVWDLRDAPSSGILIRKPRTSLVRPLGSLSSSEGPASLGSLKPREAGALFAGAGPAAPARAGLFGAGPKAAVREGMLSEPAGLAGRGGTLQKASMPGGLGGSAGGGSFGGGSASIRPSHVSSPLPAGGSASEGALGSLVRKAKALIPPGVRRLAGIVGGSAVQSFSGALPTGGFGSAAGFSASGGAAASAVEPAGIAATQAGAAGGAITAAQASLAALPKITDTKDVKRPGAEEGDEEELERLRRLFGGNFEEGLGIEPPDTALGRCMGRISLGARCRGYTCAANDASSILGELDPAREAGFETAAKVLSGVKRDVEAQLATLQAAKTAVAGKAWSCINCEQLNECALAADQKLFNATAVLGGEKTNLESALRDLKGNTPAALGSGGSVLVAASHEQAVLDDHLANLLKHIETFRSACVAGIPAEIAVGYPPHPEPEPAGVEAKREFEALAGPLTDSLNRVRTALTPSWCSRHGCPAPDTGEARTALREHVDTIDVFQDFLLGGDGRAMREASSRLDRARGLMPQGGSARGQSFFSGLFELWNASQLAEDGGRAWRRSAASACSID